MVIGRTDVLWTTTQIFEWSECGPVSHYWCELYPKMFSMLLDGDFLPSSCEKMNYQFTLTHEYQVRNYTSAQHSVSNVIVLSTRFTASETFQSNHNGTNAIHCATFEISRIPKTVRWPSLSWTSGRDGFIQAAELEPSVSSVRHVADVAECCSVSPCSWNIVQTVCMFVYVRRQRIVVVQYYDGHPGPLDRRPVASWWILCFS
jgi:hypothetical protein